MLRLLVIVMTLLAWPAIGAMVEGLYQGRIAIDSQSYSARQQAMRQALSQVLVKVRGKPDILEHPGVKSQLRSADELLSQYRFEQQQQQLYYLASFDVAKVDKLVRSAGFSVWGARRPSTLMWLAIAETPNKRVMVDSQRHPELIRALTEQARRRGIVVRFPLFDLTDLERVSPLDVWGRFIEHIQGASERYRPQVVFSARLYPLTTPGENSADTAWRGDWDMAMEQPLSQGQVTASEPVAVARQLVNTLASQLAERYATDTAAASGATMTMLFDNVQDLQAYMGIARVLSSLAVVSDVRLTRIKGSQAQYGISLLGSEEDMLQALSLEPRIRRQQDRFGQPVTDNRFVWVTDD